MRLLLSSAAVRSIGLAAAPNSGSTLASAVRVSGVKSPSGTPRRSAASAAITQEAPELLTATMRLPSARSRPCQPCR